MSDLIRYDESLVPEILSFENSGVLCYLNSIVQALLSLPAFNQLITSRATHFQRSNNRLALALIDIYEENHRSSPDSRRLNVGSLDKVLRELIQRRKQNSRDNALMVGRQEDADEGFHMLLNSLDGDLQNLNSHTSSNYIEVGFHIRYDTVIRCRGCKFEHRAGDAKFIEPPELTIHIPERDDVIGRIDNQEAMERYIMMRSEYPDGYRCEKCNAENTQNTRVVVKKTMLRRLSSVIVITFKNYPEYNSDGRKALHYFPPSMQFMSKDGILTYKSVAKIEHYGSMSGGHYMAYCKRYVHPYTHEERIRNYESIITKMESNRTDKNADQIKAFKRLVRNAKHTTMDIFLMNDSTIKYCTEGITPSYNTYMVFYHLV